MAGPFNLDAHMETVIGPVQSWDALVCTSRAVKKTMEMLFERWHAYMADRYGATRLPTPQLPILPLGVDVAKFRKTDARIAAGRAWRQRLGIADDALAVLYLGRLSYVEKAHPTPMFIALEQAAKASGRKMHAIMAGWFPMPEHEEAFREAARLYAPSIGLSIVDARVEPAKTEIWHAADVFASLVDNIQETFGLAPVEAMAAGLPVVVSDWDGYRDTVRDGEDGFRIPTYAPPGGAGALLPLGNAALNELPALCRLDRADDGGRHPAGGCRLRLPGARPAAPRAHGRHRRPARPRGVRLAGGDGTVPGAVERTGRPPHPRRRERRPPRWPFA